MKTLTSKAIRITVVAATLIATLAGCTALLERSEFATGPQPSASAEPEATAPAEPEFDPADLNKDGKLSEWEKGYAESIAGKPVAGEPREYVLADGSIEVVDPKQPLTPTVHESVTAAIAPHLLALRGAGTAADYYAWVAAVDAQEAATGKFIESVVLGSR